MNGIGICVKQFETMHKYNYDAIKSVANGVNNKTKKKKIIMHFHMVIGLGYFDSLPSWRSIKLISKYLTFLWELFLAIFIFVFDAICFIFGNELN